MIKVKTIKPFKIEQLKGKYPETTLIRGYMLLEDMNLNIWISAGTALGLYRDKQFIPHDTDINVEIYLNENQEEVAEAIISTFEMNKFLLIRTQYENNKPIQLAFIDEDNNVIFDIYFYYEYNKTEYYNHNECGYLVIPKNLITNKQKLKTRFGDFYMPYPFEEYLSLRYGNKWKIPKHSKEAWSIDANNLTK